MKSLFQFLRRGQVYVAGGRLSRKHPWAFRREVRLRETSYAVGKWRFVVWAGRLR